MAALGENLGLNEAAFHGHWRLCQFLIEQGADVNRPLANTGESPLHAAVCKAIGTEQAIQLLLDAGAKIDAKDMIGDSPLSWSSWHLRPDSVLRKLCYDGFSIHPDRNSTFDHGCGWGAMEVALLGTPHV
ncbi:MAG: ankyrin repeat domain-containing protein [Gammaproteobacteria bacterium]